MAETYIITGDAGFIGSHIAERRLKDGQRVRRTGDIKYSRVDVTKATDLLDFAPFADFDTGLARTVEWFKSR